MFLYNNDLLSFLNCFLHKLTFYSTIPSKFTALPCSSSTPEKGCHLASNSLPSPGFSCSLFSWLLIHTDHRALPNPNTTATADMLLTGSSIGRFCENNFAIVDHLEEEHKQGERKGQFTRVKRWTLEFMKSTKSAHETYLASIKNKMSSPAWGVQDSGGYKTPWNMVVHRACT